MRLEFPPGDLAVSMGDGKKGRILRFVFPVPAFLSMESDSERGTPTSRDYLEQACGHSNCRLSGNVGWEMNAVSGQISLR